MFFFDNFGFYKTDRIAIAILVIVIAVCAVIFSTGGSDDSGIFASDDSTQQKDDASARGGVSVAEGGKGYYYVEGSKTQLFPFDPNTADSTQLLQLGLQPWMVRNIYKYRAAGGVYRKPSDFARLYGLTLKQYKILEPYIRISEDYRPASEFYSDDTYADSHNAAHSQIPRDSMKYPYKLSPGETVLLNSADTTQLKKIPGIGSAYAKAIVRRREKLGGFYSASQLREIDGFPEEALRYVKVDASAIRKLKINVLTYSQLRQHPYLNYYQARDIIDFRRVHGPLKSISQLEMMDSFTIEDIKAIRHYIEF